MKKSAERVFVPEFLRSQKGRRVLKESWQADYRADVDVSHRQCECPLKDLNLQPSD